MSADLILLAALLAFSAIGYAIGYGHGYDTAQRLGVRRYREQKRLTLEAHRRLAIHERAALEAARHDRVRLSPTERDIVARLDEELGS